MRFKPVRGFWRNRSALIRLGLTPSELGIVEPWLARFVPSRKPPQMIYILQKNSGLARRVRAVAASRAQSSMLDAENKTYSNSASYSWSIHQLLRNANRPVRRTAPEVVYAVVRLHRAQENPSAASRVRVQDVYDNHAAAERARELLRLRHPDTPWAVITYPVGEMLF